MPLDVLEHIEDPRKFLHALLVAFPHAKPVVITVPARMELWSNYNEFYGNFLRYSRRSLLLLARKTGLKPIELKYIFVGLYPAMFFLARFAGKRSVEARPPSGVTALLHASLGRVFLAEECVPLMGRLPGTSVIGVFSIPRLLS
jgi:hypothetical protein